MALLNIRTWPDQVLVKKAERVDCVDDTIRTLMDDMLETMHANHGIGLAAPQVGVSKCVIVVDVTAREEASGITVLANPEIIGAEGEIEYDEGCLSLPGFLTPVRRSEMITVRGLDREGVSVLIRAEGLYAIALQHEIDHLEGTLILDKANLIKRQFYKKRVRKRLAAEKAAS